MFHAPCIYVGARKFFSMILLVKRLQADASRIFQGKMCVQYVSVFDHAGSESAGYWPRTGQYAEKTLRHKTVR